MLAFVFKKNRTFSLYSAGVAKPTTTPREPFTSRSEGLAEAGGWWLEKEDDDDDAEADADADDEGGGGDDDDDDNVAEALDVLAAG